MSLVLRPPGHLHVTLLLFRREMAARLASIWLYAVASLVCVIAWFYGGGFQRSFETESVLVTTDPLMALHVMIVVFLGVVLGLRLAAGVAWERENGTMEVLLVGPVSHEAVILSKFAVELCVLVLLIAIYVSYLQLAQPLGAGVTSIGDTLIAARMPVHALPLLALGVLVSAWARTVRGAIVAYLSLVILLGAFEAVLGYLAGRSPQELSLAAAYLRSAMQGVAMVLDPVSPVARLADLVRAMTQQALPSHGQSIAALIVTAVMLALAAVVSRMRGAVP